MKHLLVVSVSVAAMCMPAIAADLPVKPPPKAPLWSSPACQWCGLYFGASAGYGGADFIANFDDSRDLTSLSAKHSANSILGGAHLGYNYQFGSFVLGAETDISMTGIKSKVSGAESTLPWLGTTRLRGGFLVTNDLLVYGTGGAAYGHVKVSDATCSNMVFTTPTVGWALGGGAEYAMTSNIVIGAEYLHVDLDGPSVTNGLQTLGTRVPVDIVRGRLSYRF
jgi:outer membrane immunogenic protein